MSILTGKVHKVFDTQQITDTFTKRELVVETDGEYPQYIKIEFVKDKTALLDELNEGDSVTVSYDLRGREWNGKYFTNVQGWKLEKTGSAPAPVTVNETDSGADDDLPF